ncbi:exonuclease domain-containing protein [Chitinophaga horti]|uniref:Exonuclease domain-containing protein n=1 Tax=Chitinophaga horti TaxID=2920382 RepID=A0ABY6J5V1_9BACT|nr:exonuclease domain-containing protein [Chitinophaga horti]UYQ95055.1 exonuclease domain-containing protein [Chitinophaga horti]
MYAIVDIETTGGHASASGITEVAIFISDGIRVVDQYQTLINPGVKIPTYITALTGITNEMVADAPYFEDVAGEIFALLKDHIFVAHHVNFDYSFLKFHLAHYGYDLNTKKLCTVRLGRKIFPGFPSYSLGNLCRSLQIPILNRHRAGGDAEATAKLFAMLVEADANGAIAAALKPSSKEHFLPPNLPVEQVRALPGQPGVYYFHDEKGKVIYVGKAKNISKRVNSHFTGNNAGRQRQEFLRNIHSISYEATGTELMAFILESLEIKRLWPAYNYSQKRIEARFGFYLFEDQQGYLRLAIEKRRKHTAPIYSFNLMVDGRNRLKSLVTKFELCPRLCFLQTDPNCVGRAEHTCHGACDKEEAPETYNNRVLEAIQHLQDEQPSYIIMGNGRGVGEQSCILMERGRFYGMGYLTREVQITSIDGLKDYLTPYPENEYILNLIRQYAVTKGLASLTA